MESDDNAILGHEKAEVQAPGNGRLGATPRGPKENQAVIILEDGSGSDLLAQPLLGRL